tara:strand:- start:12483 stop:12659 length:177 start_codon:yes stop_codon:yes gene_type:complete
MLNMNIHAVKSITLLPAKICDKGGPQSIQWRDIEIETETETITLTLFPKDDFNLEVKD